MTDEEIARLERLAAGYAGPESDVIVQLLTALKEARAGLDMPTSDDQAKLFAAERERLFDMDRTFSDGDLQEWVNRADDAGRLARAYVEMRVEAWSQFSERAKLADKSMPKYVARLEAKLKEARAENESKESALLKSQEWVRRLTEESDQQKAKIAAMEEASTRIEEYTVHGCTGAERKCTIVLSQCNCGLTQARKDLSTAKGMPS